MKVKKWHIFLVICLCLTLSAPVLAADCMALKKGLKAERDLKKKRKMLADAIMQCPADAIINYKYGLSLERFRKYEKALGHYQKAILADPKMANAYAGIGDVSIYLGSLDDAIDAYENAVKLKPDSKRYRNRMAHLLIKRKALRGEVVSVSEFIQVMSHRGKIPNNMSLLLTGPALQYRIAFAENSDSLDLTGVSQLRSIGQAMQNDALKDIRFEISTYVESADSPEAALESSKIRALVLKDQLISNFQIDPKRLEIAWYGDAHPLETDKKGGGIVANQRVEFKRITE